MTTVVLGASVAAKWFLPGPSETLRDEAFNLLGQYADGKVSA